MEALPKKKAIHSKELWLTFIYGVAEMLPQIYEDPMFQELMNDQMVWIRPLYMVTMIYLRIFKTSQAIELPSFKRKPKENAVDAALRKEVEDQGLV